MWEDGNIKVIRVGFYFQFVFLVRYYGICFWFNGLQLNWNFIVIVIIFYMFVKEVFIIGVYRLFYYYFVVIMFDYFNFF